MPESRSSIEECCLTQDLDGLRSCLAEGQQVDRRNDVGVTPLQICAARGWTEAAALLLANGADVHLKCPLGWTALMQAVRNGHSDTVKFLIGAGARVTDKNSHDWDVISLAVASRDEELLTMLVQMAKVSDLSLALAMACQLGQLEAVKLLLNRKADINRKLPSSGLTPLMLASSAGHRDIVRILLSNGADVSIFNSSYLTSLDFALMNEHQSIAVMLSKRKKPGLLASPTLDIPLSFMPSKTSPLEPFSAGYFRPSQACSHPCTPLCITPQMTPQGLQVFRFPPTCVCSPTICMPPLNSPYQSISPFSAYSVLPNPKCVSPSFSPSPMVPPWIFSNHHWPHNMEPRFKVKGRSWWRRLKRIYKRKKAKKKGIKVYVTFEERNEGPSDKELEALLQSLNLPSLIPLMKSHEIDAETFQHLSNKDLEELGIVDRAFQLSILQKIRTLHGKA